MNDASHANHSSSASPTRFGPRSRRGQIQGQVLIYILTIIIVGLLVLFGYKFIRGLLVQGCTVEEVQFKTEIESAFKQYTSYQSVNVQSFDAPCSYEILCIVDAGNITDGAASNTLSVALKGINIGLGPLDPVKNLYYFVETSINPSSRVGGPTEPAVQRNVFLLTDKGELQSSVIWIPEAHVLSSGQLPRMTGPLPSLTPILCMKTRGGKFSLKFEGLGRGVRISEEAP